MEEKQTILEQWRNTAYMSGQNEQEGQMFWANYFSLEKGIYQFKVELPVMVGFLDGINDSLVKKNPIEKMKEDTKVILDYDNELLYKNMIEAKADWLYELEEWNDIITQERRDELYKEQKKSHTVVKEKKVGRNDPCPCGSGKKFKQCCGR